MIGALTDHTAVDLIRSIDISSDLNCCIVLTLCLKGSAWFFGSQTTMEALRVLAFLAFTGEWLNLKIGSDCTNRTRRLWGVVFFLEITFDLYISFRFYCFFLFLQLLFQAVRRLTARMWVFWNTYSCRVQTLICLSFDLWNTGPHPPSFWLTCLYTASCKW